jgi:S-DNA-T family DNA segregation ATPase FtsK/SpoIIIE
VSASYHNVLIGSIPGQGKTVAVRVLSCGAALDPLAEL